MATEKILQTRILNKVDTLSEWSNSSLKIKKGELCFATVAASAGTGLEEPVVMVKIGTEEEKTFAELPWSFYAKASDVLAACKSEAGLTAFVNNVIANAGIASSEAMTKLAERVTKLEGDENTDGSVAKAIKDAIDALDLANTYAAKEHDHTHEDITDFDTAVAAVKVTNATKADEATKATQDGNGKVIADTYETKADAKDKLDAAKDFATQSINDFGSALVSGVDTEGNDVIVACANEANSATKATQDGDGNVIADTYAKKATTLAGYEIDDAYTKTEVNNLIQGAKDYADNNDANTEYHVEYDSANKKIKLVAGADASKMEIPTDDFIKDGMIQSVAISDDGKNLVITWNTDAGKEATNIPLTELVDVMTGVDGTTITVSVSADDKISAEVKTGSIKDGHIASDAAIAKGKLASDVRTSLSRADSAIQAADLDTMAKETATDYVKKSEATGYGDILTKTEAVGAYQPKGEYYTKTEADAAFTNPTEVDGQIDAKITALDLANTYQAKGDYATAEQGGKADTAIQTVAGATGSGLKATKTGTDVVVDFDNSITFIFNCGTSAE